MNNQQETIERLIEQNRQLKMDNKILEEGYQQALSSWAIDIKSIVKESDIAQAHNVRKSTMSTLICMFSTSILTLLMGYRLTDEVRNATVIWMSVLVVVLICCDQWMMMKRKARGKEGALDPKG